MPQTNNYVQKYVTSGGSLTDSLIFDDGSSVGIGTTGPTQRVQIDTSGSATTVQRALFLENPVNWGNGGGLDIHAAMSNYDIGTVRFIRDNSNARVELAGANDGTGTGLAVIQGGNVGIGTTTPTQRVQIDTSGSATTVQRALFLENPVNWGNGGGLDIHAAMSNYDIGTVRFIRDNSNARVELAGANDGTGTGLAVLQGGNVGIGTTSPTEKIEVYNGNILANLGHLRFTQVAAPGALTATVLAVAGNVDIGPHSYRVTFITAAGETEGGISSATITTSAGHQQVSLSNLPTGASGIVTGRKIYRIGTNLASYGLLTTINDNTTTSYTDNVSDSSLTAVIPGVNSTAGALVVDGVRQVQLDSHGITFHPQETVWDPGVYSRSFTRNIKVLTSVSNEFGAYFE